MDGNFFATKILSRTQNLGHAEGGMYTWECTKQKDTKLEQQIKGIFLNRKFTGFGLILQTRLPRNH